MTKTNNDSMKNEKKPHKKPLKEYTSIAQLRKRYKTLKNKETYDKGEKKYDKGNGTY